MRNKKPRKILRVIIILFFVFIVYFVFNKGYKFIEDIKNQDIVINKKQGNITIINIDSETHLPIKDVEYIIIDNESGEIVEILKTNKTGRAKSKLLDYETNYKIKQTKIDKPYKLNREEFFIEIQDSNNQITVDNGILEHVKEIQRNDDGSIDITEVYIPVATVMQKPELPNGCEITSLTSVLNYYGYDVSKTKMADEYLPKESFVIKDKILYGANPYKAYAGNPRDEKGAFFCYAMPIVKAAQDYLDIVNSNNNSTALDISGSMREDIISYLDEGIPVVIWITLDLEKPRINYSWHLNDTKENFDAPVNLHCVVINGYKGNRVHVMDPLKGQVIYDVDSFFESYYALGSHAAIVNENQ